MGRKVRFLWQPGDSLQEFSKTCYSHAALSQHTGNDWVNNKNLRRKSAHSTRRSMRSCTSTLVLLLKHADFRECMSYILCSYTHIEADVLDGYIVDVHKSNKCIDPCVLASIISLIPCRATNAGAKYAAAAHMPFGMIGASQPYSGAARFLLLR